MRRFGTPEISLHIWGDWLTVISAREHWDELIEQKPLDEDGGDWKEYRIRCQTTADLVKAYAEFHDRLKLHCAFGTKYKSQDGAIEIFAFTGDGPSQEPYAQVIANFDDDKRIAGVKSAIETLQEAIK